MKSHGINKQRELLATLAVFIVIVAIVTTAAATNSTNKTTPKQSQSQVQLSSTNAAPGSQYQNGTFSATSSYDSPGGPEAFTLKVTLKDDVISDTSAVSGSKDDTSRIYQQQFIGGYKQLVVGKKIGDVKLGVVSGSSLTSQGFAADITKIEQEAKQG